MADTANTLKPVPVRRRSAARLAAVQMSYQGQMSGQSVAEFLPVFLQHELFPHRVIEKAEKPIVKPTDVE